MKMKSKIAPMSEDDIHCFADLMIGRIMGWGIPMSINPKTGYVDSRTKRARAENHLRQDILMNLPGYLKLTECLRTGGDVVELWPEELREVVRFRISHKVPRDCNEPTSDYSREAREESGNDPYPEWMMQHGTIATIDDHPPYPPKTQVYKCWQMGPNVIPFPTQEQRQKRRPNLPDDDNQPGGAA
ncbi:hypothetical protein [uncultured Nitratireductor sp.]|uniref:hypothetical protein n=1 Tax=uncultured Nitratireductor sp. TaxID=520953 RepID=UPI002628D668|nr:hypothetical protein [uncultured Nitratireductor sp.]